jgi:hypothetical protein
VQIKTKEEASFGLSLSLALFVLGACTADDANDATAVDNLALVTDLFY